MSPMMSSSTRLIGGIYDDGGNRMSPTHANKRGARYRYYVSHGLLQNRPQEAGSVSRVPAPEVESIVVQALREHLNGGGAAQQPPDPGDRELVERHVERIVIKSHAIHVFLRLLESADEMSQIGPDSMADSNGNGSNPVMLALPWTAPRPIAAKEILPALPAQARRSIPPDLRDALLTAIGRARRWIEELIEDRVSSFAQIAKREGKVERHIRFLAPLALVSPRIVAAIIDGSAPADLTITALAKALPYSWAEQERQLGLPPG